MRIGLDYTLKDIARINYIVLALMHTAQMNEDEEKKKIHCILPYIEKEGK
jgi:hypothetical protein